MLSYFFFSSLAPVIIRTTLYDLSINGTAKKKVTSACIGINRA